MVQIILCGDIFLIDDNMYDLDNFVNFYRLQSLAYWSEFDFWVSVIIVGECW